MISKFSLTPVLFFLLFSLYGQNQLPIPDTISGTNFELNLQNGTVQFYEGQETTTMGTNGNILGPTLFMNKNDFVNIHVNNNIEDTTTIHWHGMHVSAANDGGPHTTIAPGESWNPKFTVLDKAGTYWYHPHLHEKTNKHVSFGIAGFIVVRDNEEKALSLPRTYGVDDFPLVVQTKDFDENNQIIVPSNSDDVPMVNATINPFLEVPAQMVRFRLLNGSSQRVFNLGLTGNQVFYQIGSDGGLLNKPVAHTRLQMAPGERAEIVIGFSEMKGNSIQLMSYASELSNGIYGAAYPGMGFMMTLIGYNPNPLNGINFKLLEFRVVDSTTNPVILLPETLVNDIPLSENQAKTTRNLVFTPSQMGPNQLNGNFLINGQHFNMDVINFSIPLNNTEIWTIANQSAIAHPFHIHDVQFYVLDRNGLTPPVSEQGRKDVILIHPMETVRFITQFTDFANDSVPYMLHCHMLTHEDKGMMLQFEVVDQTTRIQQMVINNDVVKFYPNPLSSKNSILSVSGIKSELVKYELYDLLGQLSIKGEESIKNNSFQIDVSGIKPGAYLIKIWADNSTYQQKIVVK